MDLASLTGVVLDGKYRIEQQLGKGGMGAVFHAIHLGTTRTVAVEGNCAAGSLDKTNSSFDFSERPRRRAVCATRTW